MRSVKLFFVYFYLLTCLLDIRFCGTSFIDGHSSLPATESHGFALPPNVSFFDATHAIGSYDDIVPHPGKLIPNCKSFLIEFSKQAADFIKCSVVNARPFRFCERCASHYLKAMRVYYDIKKNDENLDDCRGELLLSDRVQIINSISQSITDIWVRADCKNCFAVLSEDNNGTVTEELTQHSKQFLSLYGNFTKCVPKNITAIGKKGRIHNETICTDCAIYYEAMNVLYTQMRGRDNSPQPVCMDIVDMMNYTRLMWGETLGCTVTHKDLIAVITITMVLLFIPVVFYVGLAVYGTKKQRKCVQDKRLSKYTLSNNYGSNEHSPLLSQSYDITASTATNQHLMANSLTEGGHIQDPSLNNISSNRLLNRQTENSVS